MNNTVDNPQIPKNVEQVPQKAFIETCTSYITQTYQSNYIGFFADILTVATAIITILTLITVKNFKIAQKNNTIYNNALLKFKQNVDAIRKLEASQEPISENYFKETIELMKYVYRLQGDLKKQSRITKLIPVYNEIINSTHTDKIDKVFLVKLETMLEAFNDN